MSQCKLQILNFSGHKEERYDPTDAKAVDRIKDMIVKTMKKGWTLYGCNISKGEKDYKKLLHKSELTNEDLEKKLDENDRFMLRQDKLLLAPPVKGG